MWLMRDGDVRLERQEEGRIEETGERTRIIEDAKLLGRAAEATTEM